MRARSLLMFPALLLPAAGVFLARAEHFPALAAMRSASVMAPRDSPAMAPAAPPPPQAVAPPAAPVAATASAAGTSSEATILATEANDPAAEPGLAANDPASLATLPAALVDDGSDDLPDPEPSAIDPAPSASDPAAKASDPAAKASDAAPSVIAPAPPARRDGPLLASTARETWVFAEPRWSSRRIGYLRAGAIVERRAKPAGWASCPDGWYRVEPKGYVCAGATATLDVTHPVIVASAKRPGTDGLPYTYAMGRFPPPPLYTRLPTRAEQEKAEPDLVHQMRKAAVYARDLSFVAPPPADPLPPFLQSGTALPPLANVLRSADAITAGRARVRSGFALLGTFEHEGRRFGMTTDLTLLPLDRARIVKPSAFHGITLDETTTLPVAFARSKHAFRYTMNEAGALSRGEPLAHREAVPVTDVVKRSGGMLYLQAKDGSFVQSEQVVKIEKFRKAPAWAAAGRKWIDVSILRQSLIAYEGEKPVYVTLVSTGADGTGDPKKTHSTIQGAFLIHTKHTTVTMDGDTVGDEFDFRDVPFVQYFTEGFALHAAYWHDEFGTPRSHGCVNLAPIDAAHLFAWTDPVVPEGWHAALSLKRGTLVYSHP